MALPTSYDANGVREYMENVLGKTAHNLSLSATKGDFTEPANEVLYILGESDFTFVNTAAEAAKVRALARVEAWRFAMYSTAHEASFSAGSPGTGQTQRADVHRHCKAMYDLAKSELLEKYPSLGQQTSREVKSYSVDYVDDYYRNAKD